LKKGCPKARKDLINFCIMGGKYSGNMNLWNRFKESRRRCRNLVMN